MILFIFILAGIPFGVLVWAIIHEYRKPKWLKVYEYINDASKDIDFNNEYDFSLLTYELEKAFNLTVSQAEECIHNRNLKWWFKSLQT